MSVFQITIAHEHPLSRIGLERVLASASAFEVSMVSSLAELHQQLGQSLPHVVVLSVFSAADLKELSILRRQYPKLGILCVSRLREETVGVQAILAGASGYLDEQADPAAMVEAIRRVASGERSISPKLGTALCEYMVQGRPHDALSDREYSVLLKIAEGLTTAEIAAQLHLSTKTIGSFRARMLRKMGLSTTAELTRYVVENGLNATPDGRRSAN